MFDHKRFKAAMIIAEKTIDDIARELGVDKSTIYRKISSDGNFTREEMNKLIPLLNLSNEEVKEIFFAEKLA
jgi:DNA-binding phage protein